MGGELSCWGRSGKLIEGAAGDSSVVERPPQSTKKTEKSKPIHEPRPQPIGDLDAGFTTLTEPQTLTQWIFQTTVPSKR